MTQDSGSTDVPAANGTIDTGSECKVTAKQDVHVHMPSLHSGQTISVLTAVSAELACDAESTLNGQVAQAQATLDESSSSQDQNQDTQNEPLLITPLLATTIPPYPAMSMSHFKLGVLGQDEAIAAISAAYRRLVELRPNTFDVPYGTSGREFIAQLSIYLECFAQGGPYEGHALMIAMVYQGLLLQKPYNCSPSLASKCLKRRLDLWKQGKLDELLHECETIHQQIGKSRHQRANRRMDEANQFASWINKGKIHSALGLLKESHFSHSSGILHLDDRIGDKTVFDILRDKHPPAAELQAGAVLDGAPPNPPHPVQFEALTRQGIRQAALHTTGAAGPSGVNADSWRRMCTSFADVSDQLCDALAACARRVAGTYIDPSSLVAYTACRLIPLDKHPGVRPIGIGEVMRRIIGKAILQLLRNEILDAAGSLQLCAGQDCGIEAAIHAMREVFNDSTTEAVLLADATNAFNSLNREAALRNVQHLCPSLAPVVINTYRQPANLYVGGETISSEEGTTQGDPIAMVMYAVAIIPLLKSVATEGATQAWYADDGGAGGKLMKVRMWWDKLVEKGPLYGYHLNPRKSVLLVKPQYHMIAVKVFADTNVEVRCDGCCYLGAAIGSPVFLEQYARKKVDEWVAEVLRLSVFAKSQPQAAYSAFVHGLRNKWTFLCRTLPDMDIHLRPLDLAISDTLLPAIIGRTISTVEREVLALPCRLGGLGLPHLSSFAAQYHSSCKITFPLAHLIAEQTPELGDAIQDVRDAKQRVKTAASESIRATAATLSATLDADFQRVITLAAEKGASSWLTCRPIKRHGFALTKGEFRDGIHLRYNWLPPRLPSSCGCGSAFSVSHALSCPTGGFPTLRHNEVRDVTASLLKRVANNVAVEPHLQPVTGEQFRHRCTIKEDQARLDVAASGIWGGRFERTFIDVRVFNPHAPSNRSIPLATCYAKHEREKRRCYEQRILNVEQSSFVPAVFSSTGGMGKHAKALYNRIASLLADKSGETYSIVNAWIRCKLSFALLRASVVCLRGSRGLQAPTLSTSESASVAVMEADI